MASALGELCWDKRRVFSENLRVWPETNAGTRDTFLYFSYRAELTSLHERLEGSARRHTLRGVLKHTGLTPVKGHGPRLTIAIHLNVKTLGQSIHH